MPPCHGHCLTLLEAGWSSSWLDCWEHAHSCPHSAGGLVGGPFAILCDREMLGRVRPILPPSHCTCIHSDVQNSKYKKKYKNWSKTRLPYFTTTKDSSHCTTSTHPISYTKTKYVHMKYNFLVYDLWSGSWSNLSRSKKIKPAEICQKQSLNGGQHSIIFSGEDYEDLWC